MLTRRRFLAIAAAIAAAPAGAQTPVAHWQGRAMGSDASIRLSGVSQSEARLIFRKVEAALDQVETQFSLFRDSALTRLNRDGRLAWPDSGLLRVFELSDRVHAATAGAFDPSVQPLWQAVAQGRETASARALIGWDKVHFGPEEIRFLRPGMALTFNGIAQGEAADRIAALLRAEGCRDVLVDMGEIVASGERPGGGGWRARITTPDGVVAGTVPLRDTALATSAPSGTRIGPSGRESHILDPRGQAPLWRVVSVAAPSAALADALSTAFCVMDRPAIDAALARVPETRVVKII